MIALSGNTVTKLAGNPKDASAMATLASAPPNVATNWGVCKKRSKPGGASRSMISPKVTTFSGIKLSRELRRSWQ
jgi:hypothetical protein